MKKYRIIMREGGEELESDKYNYWNYDPQTNTLRVESQIEVEKEVVGEKKWPWSKRKVTTEKVLVNKKTQLFIFDATSRIDRIELVEEN